MADETPCTQQRVEATYRFSPLNRLRYSQTDSHRAMCASGCGARSPALDERWRDAERGKESATSLAEYVVYLGYVLFPANLPPESAALPYLP